MSGRLKILVLTGVLACVLVAAAGRAQTPRPRQLPTPDRVRPMLPDTALRDLMRRLIELDRLISVGSVGRAETLVEELSAHSVLADQLRLRRIRLARLRGDHAEAARLTAEALTANPRASGLWRDLMVARLALVELDAARAAADSFLQYAPNRRSAAIITVEQFLGAGHPATAVALVDSLRPLLQEPRLLARQRAVGLLAMGDQMGAAAEIANELEAVAYNYSLVRTALLDGPYRSGEHQVFRERITQLAQLPDAVPEMSLLALDFALVGEEPDAAGELARQLATTMAGRRALLRGASVLIQELRLLESKNAQITAVAYIWPMLTDLLREPASGTAVRRRAAELIPAVCSAALDLRILDSDPHRAATRCDELLALAERELPFHPDLHAARISLALYLRDELGEAATAAGQLERMLLDLDLPAEGVALVRLTLGECYFAAGDTLRGRTVLTRLGRDRSARRAAGHAHFHLARLDLAGGEYASARDRFAAVALDNPGAPYANDALELGLAVAEELENPTGGTPVLALYGHVVYERLAGDRETERAALSDFVTGAAVLVDVREKQGLLERGRWELANLALAAGDTTGALEMFDTIIGEHAEGRRPAASLSRVGAIHAAAGRTMQARDAWERLLVQYPGFLFADDVRDTLRSLP